MRRFLTAAIAALIAASLLLAIPRPAVQTAPEPAPVPVAQPEKAPAKRVVFTRPEAPPPAPDPTAEALEPTKPSGPAPSSDPELSEAAEPAEAIDLFDLDEDTRRDLVEDAGEHLNDLVEKCGSTIDDPAKVAAHLTLDDRGLYTMELLSWEDDAEAQRMNLTDEPVPVALSDCLEEHLWDRDWFEMDAGSSVKFALSMRFEPEPEGPAGD